MSEQVKNNKIWNLFIRSFVLSSKGLLWTEIMFPFIWVEVFHIHIFVPAFNIHTPPHNISSQYVWCNAWHIALHIVISCGDKLLHITQCLSNALAELGGILLSNQLIIGICLQQWHYNLTYLMCVPFPCILPRTWRERLAWMDHRKSKKRRIRRQPLGQTLLRKD